VPTTRRPGVLRPRPFGRLAFGRQTRVVRRGEWNCPWQCTSGHDRHISNASICAKCSRGDSARSGPGCGNEGDYRRPSWSGWAAPSRYSGTGLPGFQCLIRCHESPRSRARWPGRQNAVTCLVRRMARSRWLRSSGLYPCCRDWPAG